MKKWSGSLLRRRLLIGHKISRSLTRVTSAGRKRGVGAWVNEAHVNRLSRFLPSYSLIVFLSLSPLSHLLSSLDIDSHSIIRAGGELNLTICFLLFEHYDL